MREYKLYPVNPDGHIVGPPIIRYVGDDEKALQEAERVLDGHDLEVWDGPRFIKKLKSKAKSESVLARLKAAVLRPRT